MKISTRSVLMAGVAVLTAGSLTFTQSVQPPAPPAPAPSVQLAGGVQLTALTPLPPLITTLLSNPLILLGPAATPGTLPPPPAPIQFAIAPNIADTIDAIYIAVEPWVEYGFALAESVLRWIPYVGWFAGQIGVFYRFFEGMVASGVFNFTDFLRGDGGVVTNLVDFGIDVGLAFVWLGLDEVAQFFPLPPFCCYPPRPPVQGPFLALDSLETPTETAELMTTASVEETTSPEPRGEDLAEEVENVSQEEDATVETVAIDEVQDVAEAEEAEELVEKAAKDDTTATTSDSIDTSPSDKPDNKTADTRAGNPSSNDDRAKSDTAKGNDKK